jgi:flavin-dependent dehydrogenase
LAGARRIEPVRNHPLRTDLTARTQTDGLLLAGEAAGLTNPVSGEGVHYALESGLTAAQVAAEALAKDDVTGSRLAVYGRRLRERYASRFRCLGRMRRWYLRERVLDLIVQKVHHRPRLKYLFANAVLGPTDPGEATSLVTLAKILF